VSSTKSLKVSPGTTSSPISRPARSRRRSNAGASITSKSSSAARSQVAKGVTPSGLRKNRVRAVICAGSDLPAWLSMGLIRQSSRSIWSLQVSIASRTGSTLAEALKLAKEWISAKPERGVTTVLIPTLKSNARVGCWPSIGCSGRPGENTPPLG
jgi:hypothetical protein